MARGQRAQHARVGIRRMAIDKKSLFLEFGQIPYRLE